MKDNIQKILLEIETVLDKIDEHEVDSFIDSILRAKKIVLVGAGRMGLATKAFSMRLGHLGLSSYFLGDSTVPGIEEGDLLIIASGSGETQTIYDLAEIGKRNRAHLSLITANPSSRMGKLSDTIVELKAPTKTDKEIISIQPMTTLNEQCLGLFYDAVVLKMMGVLHETHDTMWARHSNLE